MEKIYGQHNSSIFNWPANIVAMLMWIGAIILGIVTDISFIGIILPFVALLVEKRSELVRDHAAKAFILNIVIGAASFVLGVLTVVLSAIGLVIVAVPLGMVIMVINGLLLVVTIMGAVKAFGYKELAIPYIGGLVEWAKAAIKTN